MNTRQPSLPGDMFTINNNLEMKQDESMLPKLRKNRKLEIRWGQEYYAALKELVFMVKPSSYIPPEVPSRLTMDNIEETLYVCKQCNDSFRIKDSLDDHIHRKSWILGYWCHHCFRPNCTHTSEANAMCLPCQNIENKNRARLSRRGLKRGQKMGSVQVFYNQCQYFSHLKDHNISTVDMAYIMLMPLPPQVENSEFDQLHETCKAIMEYAFVKQKHVVDLLRTESNSSKWWMSKASDDSPIGDLLKKYYIDSSDEFSDNCDNSDQENSSNANGNLPINSDITFVDCGPTAKAYVSSERNIGSTSIGTFPPKSLDVSNINQITPFFTDIPSLASLKKHHSNSKITAKAPSTVNDNKPKINKNIMSIFNKASTSQANALAEELEPDTDNNEDDGDDEDDLIICDFGGCLILPKSFKYHMESHSEVGKVIYYTCPFCRFFVKTISGNVDIIQNHVFKNHKHRLCEMITPESSELLKIKFNSNFDKNKLHKDKNIMSEGKIIIPKIVNACSIPSMTFEQTSDEFDYQIQDADRSIPKIVSVKSVKDSSENAVQNGMTIPKIVNVQSMSSTANSQITYVMPSKNSEEMVSFQRQCGKNRIMIKVNLHNENSNQLRDKKVIIYKPIGKMKKIPSENLVPSLNTIKFSTSALTTIPFATTSSMATGFTPILPTSISQATSSYTPNSTITSNIQQYPQSSLIEQQNHNIEIMTNNVNKKDSNVDLENFQLKSFEIPLLVSESDCSDQIDNFKRNEEKNRDSDFKLIDKNLKFGNSASSWKRSVIYTKRRGRPKKPWRIALNSPENSEPLNFKCHLCFENITTSWEVIKNHFATRHYREYRLCTVTPKLEKIKDTGENDTRIEGRKRKLGLSPPSGSKRKRRFGGLKKNEDNNSNSGICVTQEKLEEIEGNFKCKKCDELFQEINFLREHTATKHRIKEHFLVCLECGENFIVANSLQMHLKAFHGIMDPVSYLAKNSLYAPTVGSFSDKRRTIESNQCYVCMAVFEDKSAVDKHLRVHGMAFLNHTRIEARNALKIDDKRNQQMVKSQEEEQKSRVHGAHETSILTRISNLLS